MNFYICVYPCKHQQIYLLIYLFLNIYLVLAALGLRCCALALLFIAVLRLLVAVASLVVEHRL